MGVAQHTFLSTHEVQDLMEILDSRLAAIIDEQANLRAIAQDHDDLYDVVKLALTAVVGDPVPGDVGDFNARVDALIESGEIGDAIARGRIKALKTRVDQLPVALQALSQDLDLDPGIMNVSLSSTVSAALRPK
jgi:hypothetical protein